MAKSQVDQENLVGEPAALADAEVAELAAALPDLQSLLAEQRVKEARLLVKRVATRWPNSELAQHLARVLAAAVVRSRPDLRLPTHRREQAWLEEHATEHPGCWLAVLGDQLLVANSDLSVVLAHVRQAPGGELAFLHYQPEPLA